MDSEQIKKDLTNKPFFNISGPIHQDSKGSPDPAPDHRKLKGQVIAQPSDNGILQPTEHPVDPWDNESSPIEQKLSSDISELVTASINDKIELKKNLSDLYKQAHELMTRYNQRIQSLLMDDRFLYRQSSEISALMIRGLMPPLEEIKALEKSLTSTRKKSVEESIEQSQKSAGTELAKVENVLKEAKSRIIKYTKPLKPAQLMQKQLDQRLEQEAARLQHQIQKSAPTVLLNGNIETSNKIPVTIKTSSINPPLQEISARSAEKELSVEDLTSKQLKSLVKKLDNTSPEATKRVTQAILHFVESEYQHYVSLRPFLSVASKKCDLLSMNPDKACNACQNAISLLEDTSTSIHQALNNDLPFNTLVEIDKAINKLATFDKKLPGEVWQLLTELTPHRADNRYHLLNLLCRKLLLDGPTPLTQKAVLNKFKDVENYISLFKEATEDEVFDQQFLAVYGHVFTTPTHLKKALNPVNKPHELNELLKIFHRIKKNEEVLLSKATEKLKAIGDEQQLAFLLSGASAYEFLNSKLPDRISTEINNFSLLEPGSTHKKLTQSLLAKFADYYKAVELAKKQGGEINKQFHHDTTVVQLIKELSSILIDSQLPDNGQSSLLKNAYEDLQAVINQPQPTNQTMDSLASCRRNIIDALQKKLLTNNLASTVIKQFLQIQGLLENPGVLLFETRFQAPEELTQAIATLESSASPKWYNQLFTGLLQEHRANTLETVRSLLIACRNITAAPKQIARFIEAITVEIERDNDDPLIKQLVSAMQAYANQLKQ